MYVSVEEELCIFYKKEQTKKNMGEYLYIFIKIKILYISLKMSLADKIDICHDLMKSISCLVCFLLD